MKDIHDNSNCYVSQITMNAQTTMGIVSRFALILWVVSHVPVDRDTSRVERSHVQVKFIYFI